MLLLALHLATASIQTQPATAAPAKVMVVPDGGTRRRDGKEDEDAR
jgi:hypothetical protein